MRVPPPGLLKLDRAALLRDLRERLAEHYPDYADEEDFDSTDPAWILLEQAAWLVELLSEQLDRYPFSAVQQFVHMMGGSVIPAQPSIGVAVIGSESPGALAQQRDRPAPWRFFTIQTEDIDLIEFVPVEPSTDIRNVRILSISEFLDGELYCLGGSSMKTGLQAHECWISPPARSRIFNGERVRYDILSNNAEDLLETLNKALESLGERKLGWLELEAEQISTERLALHARINLAGAFSETVPGGLADGTDIDGQWGTLDDSNWTPPVRVSSDGTLPSLLRGTAPLPGLRSGTILIPGVPENFSVKKLLDRHAAPIPTGVVKAIWGTLTHMDQKLANLSPSIHRSIDEPEEAPDEPLWVSDSLAQGMWGTLADRARQTYIHIDLSEHDLHASSLRVAFVLKNVSEDDHRDIRVFGIEEVGGLSRVQLSHKVVWRLRLPDPEGGRRLVLVMGLDIKVSEKHKELLIATEYRPISVLTNAVLIANAPPVNDGREIVVTRNVPESVSLLYEDLVNKQVMGHLLEHGIPQDAAEIFKKLPLSSMSVIGQEPVRDFEGVGFDPTAGQMTVNAADDMGFQRVLRPKDVVSLDWYRRTDGAQGDVAPGLIELVEQPPRSNPTLTGVRNPLGTFFGAAREQEQEAIDRLFTPGGGIPVMPSDWERLIRVALGAKGRGWMVRCWSHAERALISNAIWPLELPGNVDPQVEAELIQLRAELKDSGPETLLVVLGPMSGSPSEEHLDWARQVVRGLVRRHMKRLPVVKRAVVTRFWPLTAIMVDEPQDLPMPCFSIPDIVGNLEVEEGHSDSIATLQDETGREVLPPNARLLLNAAVVRTVVTG
ncbi:MAG: hypothetical protein ACI8S6_002117 [Myxococcota bacterium]